jgi:hypothetical protein
MVLIRWSTPVIRVRKYSERQSKNTWWSAGLDAAWKKPEKAYCGSKKYKVIMMLQFSDLVH